MKKKTIVTTVLVIGFGISFAYMANKMFAKTNVNTKPNTEYKEQVGEHKDVDNIQETKENNNSTKSDLDTKIPVENGFKTTITGGTNEEEVIENNILLDNSTIPVIDRLEAKRVAENFVQAIVSFDTSDKEGTVKKATKYVCKDRIEEVKGFYNNLGKSQDIKKTVIKKLYSEEEKTKENNSYIYFYVAVDVDLIDKYDQEVKGTGDSYLVKLLKEDGQYKVVEYHMDK